MPKISVVLPVYNASEYLVEALDSISNQTFNDFEIIAINDGSTDNSLDILNKYSEKEPRLRIISRENKKLIETLNEGINYATGDFIARMDADDISEPDRFEKQLKYLMETKSDICGSWIRSFGKENKIIKYPSKFEDIKILALLRNPLAHPTIIAKRDFFMNFKYNKEDLHAEDYGLWLRAIISGYRIVNVPEVLLNYRVSDNQISVKHNDIQRKTSLRLKRYYRDNYIIFKSINVPDLIFDYTNKQYYKELPQAIYALNLFLDYSSSNYFSEFINYQKLRVLYYASQAYNFFEYLKILKGSKIKTIYKFCLLFSKFYFLFRIIKKNCCQKN